MNENPTKTELLDTILKDFEEDVVDVYSFRLFDIASMTYKYLAIYTTYFNKVKGKLVTTHTTTVAILNDKEGQELYVDSAGKMRYTQHCFDRYAERYCHKELWHKNKKVATFIGRNEKALIVGPCANGVDGIALVPDGILLLDMSGFIPMAKTFITYQMLQPLQTAAVTAAFNGDKTHALAMIETFKSLY